MERLKTIMHELISRTHEQLTHLECVDTKEMGEVIDMIKDLSEAIYYHTITDSMTEKEKKVIERHHEPHQTKE